jgi:hypothetical protein
MPISHSKSPKAFQENIRAEMDAGKKPKQAVAIAYNIADKEKRTGDKISKSIKKDKDDSHSKHTSEMASAYEHSVAHTKQDFHPAVTASRMKSTKD